MPLWHDGWLQSFWLKEHTPHNTSFNIFPIKQDLKKGSSFSVTLKTEGKRSFLSLKINGIYRFFLLLFSLVYHLIPSSTLWDLWFASVWTFEIGALFCGFLLFSGNLYTCNHLCVTVHFQTEQISANPRKRPDGTAGKWKGRHEEGNEALISFGSAPNNLSLVFITSLKSQRGSNLNVCFLQTHFLYPDISSFLFFFFLFFSSQSQTAQCRPADARWGFSSLWCNPKNTELPPLRAKLQTESWINPGQKTFSYLFLGTFQLGSSADVTRHNFKPYDKLCSGLFSNVRWVNLNVPRETQQWNKRVMKEWNRKTHNSWSSAQNSAFASGFWGAAGGLGGGLI